MTYKAIFVLQALLVLPILGKQACYDDIGCFSDSAPFDDMPLPMNPKDIYPTWRLYQHGKEARIISSALELNVSDLIVFTHGLAGNYENTLAWHKPIAENLLQARPTADLLFVEWEKGAAFASGLKMYSQPASNTRVIGPLIIRFLETNPKFDSTKVYCVGFSLGSHVCGFAGKAARGGWGRLTALDPALPNFDKDDASARVDKTDAAYVDVIHTSWVGLQRPVGHVDFWANGAKRQPGCVSRRRRSAEGDHLDGKPLPFDYMRRPSWLNRAGAESSESEEDSAENEFEHPTFNEKNRGLFDTAFDWVADFFGCSHYRAPELFAASILNPEQCSFLFCPCPDKKDFDKGRCDLQCSIEVGQYMGYHSYQFQNRGSFWGKTEKESPFCLKKKF